MNWKQARLPSADETELTRGDLMGNNMLRQSRDFELLVIKKGEI